MLAVGCARDEIYTLLFFGWNCSPRRWVFWRFDASRRRFKNVWQDSMVTWKLRDVSNICVNFYEICQISYKVLWGCKMREGKGWKMSDKHWKIYLRRFNKSFLSKLKLQHLCIVYIDKGSMTHNVNQDVPQQFSLEHFIASRPFHLFLSPYVTARVSQTKNEKKEGASFYALP